MIQRVLVLLKCQMHKHPNTLHSEAKLNAVSLSIAIECDWCCLLRILEPYIQCPTILYLSTLFYHQSDNQVVSTFASSLSWISCSKTSYCTQYLSTTQICPTLFIILVVYHHQPIQLSLSGLQIFMVVGCIIAIVQSVSTLFPVLSFESIFKMLEL